MGETLVTDLFGDSARRREARRRTAREFRKERTAATLTVAVAMAACGGLGAAEMLARRYGLHFVPRAWTGWLNAELRTVRWRDPVVGLAGCALLLAGLRLLLLALVPGRAGQEPIRGGDPAVSAALTREALRRSLLDATRTVPGIKRARVRIGRRITVRGYTHRSTPGTSGGGAWRSTPGASEGDVGWGASGARGAPEEVRELLRRAVLARLGEIDPQRGRRVAVRLSRRG